MSPPAFSPKLCRVSAAKLASPKPKLAPPRTRVREAKSLRENKMSDIIGTVNYHSSILLSRCQPTWTNTLPRHFCRGSAIHKPFDFLSPFYPFYMFLAAKTFTVHRRVHNHYTKPILNLILNRKKVLQRKNVALDKQKPRQTTLSRDPASLFNLQSGRFASG